MDIEITNVYQKEALTNIINRYGNFSYIDAEDIVKQIEINKSNTPIKIYDIPDYLFDHMYRICEFKKINKMEKHQFKPFDQVLVRDEDDDVWYPALFKSYNKDDDDWPYICDSLGWKQCIPYNEETAHLYDTSKPYKKPEPKVWKVTCHKNNEKFHFTNDELKDFIENAVINNKDIQWFTLTYDENNN